MKRSQEELKKLLCQAVDRRAGELKAFAMDVHHHPEHGYFEFRTSGKLAGALEALGLKVTRGLGVTGLRADLTGQAPGPRVAVMGELDAVTCRGYKFADPETGASHTCGHDMQITMVLAVASALVDTGAMEDLAGAVALFGVPAEEFIQIGQRMELRNQGSIGFLGGKQELIRTGALEDVDMAMMIHAGSRRGFGIPRSSNGFRAFTVRYQGRQAHAAGAPHEGINALYAAVAGISNVNALRETFRDEDCVRVHFIITKGGDAVNAVPDDVRLEGYVRANNMDCLAQVFEKVQRAFTAGGDALGAKTTVTSIPGYLPLRCDPELNRLFSENAAALPEAPEVYDDGHSAGSTDMGDITHIMPAIHPYAGLARGPFHSASYEILDLDQLVIQSSKALCMTLVDLLGQGAQRARSIVENFQAPLSRQDYVKQLESWFGQVQSGQAPEL